MTVGTEFICIAYKNHNGINLYTAHMDLVLAISAHCSIMWIGCDSHYKLLTALVHIKYFPRINKYKTLPKGLFILDATLWHDTIQRSANTLSLFNVFNYSIVRDRSNRTHLIRWKYSYWMWCIVLQCSIWWQQTLTKGLVWAPGL